MRLYYTADNGARRWFDPDRALARWTSGGSTLYRLKNRWLLHERDRYQPLTPDQAHQWLAEHGHEPPAAGRPPIGPKITTRIPQAEADIIARLAADAGVTTSHMLRRLITQALAAINTHPQQGDR